MIDFILLAVLVIVTWCVAAEGTWGAATVFLSVLFAGLITMNFFEPLAAAIEASVPAMAAYSDVLAYLGLFTALIFGLRAAGEYIMPTYVEVHGGLHNSLRWLLAAATGYLVVAVLMTSLHTAPLPRSFFGFNPGPGPNGKTFFGMNPDIQWLAFNQYVSQRSLGGRPFDAVAFELIPGQSTTLTTFSSFPIRYATRRSMLSSGGSVTSAAPAGPPAGGAPPPTLTPSGKSRTDAF